MVGAAAVSLGGAVIGGIASNRAADTAASAQRDAADAQAAAMYRQAEVDEKNLAFQREQYEDWEQIYGPIQENLSSFYQELDGETLIASGLREFEQQYAQTRQQLDRQFAQQGIDSPAQNMLEQQQAIGAAETRANIRNNAPMQAATAQQGFLNQQVTNPATAGISAAMGGVSNAMANQASTYGQQAAVVGNQASAYGQQAAAYGQQAAQAYGVMGQNIQQGFSAYAQYQQQQNLQQQQQWNNLAYTANSNPGYSAYSPQTGQPVQASNGWEMQ